MKTKLCPISNTTDKGRLHECRKEDCAWWDEIKEQCSIRSMAEYLGTIKIQQGGD